MNTKEFGEAIKFLRERAAMYEHVAQTLELAGAPQRAFICTDKPYRDVFGDGPAHVRARKAAGKARRGAKQPQKRTILGGCPADDIRPAVSARAKRVGELAAELGWAQDAIRQAVKESPDMTINGRGWVRKR